MCVCLSKCSALFFGSGLAISLHHKNFLVCIPIAIYINVYNSLIKLCDNCLSVHILCKKMYPEILNGKRPWISIFYLFLPSSQPPALYSVMFVKLLNKVRHPIHIFSSLLKLTGEKWVNSHLHMWLLLIRSATQRQNRNF